MLPSIIGAVCVGIISLASVQLEQCKDTIEANVYITADTMGPVRDLIAKGTRPVVEIVMEKNLGGYVDEQRETRKVIRNSKKTIVLVCQKECDSAAAMLLFAGDLAKIHKEATILFHNIRYYDKSLDKSAWIVPSLTYVKNDVDLYLLRESMITAERIRENLTMRQWYSMLDGNDVVLTGKELCSQRETLVDNSEYCIVKGNKNRKDFLEV